MSEALIEAKKAFELDEVPVGAVVVYQDNIIARAHNIREHQNLFYGHAEFIALMEASKVIGDWRLEDCEVYVTLEPCLMCAGAMLQSRVKKLFYGAPDLKGGAINSKYALKNHEFNHHIETTGHIEEIKSRDLLKTFFKKKR
jgi:tRNA(adenine34) deaminase